MTRRASHRAVVRVDPRMAKTQAQLMRARKNAALKLAREYDAAGDKFRADMARREADRYRALLDKETGKERKRKSSPLLLEPDVKVYQARTVSSEDESGPDPVGYYLMGQWTQVD